MFLTDTPRYVRKLKTKNPKKQIFKLPNTQKFVISVQQVLPWENFQEKCKQSLMGIEVYEIQDRVQRFGIQ